MRLLHLTATGTTCPLPVFLMKVLPWTVAVFLLRHCRHLPTSASMHKSWCFGPSLPKKKLAILGNKRCSEKVEAKEFLIGLGKVVATFVVDFVIVVDVAFVTGS